MKREKFNGYTNVVGGDIYKHYGLFFWQECFFCNQEFRREAGYRFQMQVGGPWAYSCAGCSSSKEHVNLNVREFLHYRPPASASPLPRKP